MRFRTLPIFLLLMLPLLGMATPVSGIDGKVPVWTPALSSMPADSPAFLWNHAAESAFLFTDSRIPFSTKLSSGEERSFSPPALTMLADQSPANPSVVSIFLLMFLGVTFKYLFSQRFNNVLADVCSTLSAIENDGR